MSIEKYAKFWFRNICDFPVDALKEKMGTDMDSIIDGLAELREILKTIYNDYKSFEVDNEEQSYDNLIYTVRFLQAIGKYGTMMEIKIICKLISLNLLSNMNMYQKNLLLFNIVPYQHMIFL